MTRSLKHCMQNIGYEYQGIPIKIEPYFLGIIKMLVCVDVTDEMAITNKFCL